MTQTPLFSSYGVAENRVTAATLAVFARIEGWLLNRLLAAVVGDANVQIVRFENQAARGRTAGSSVPDARLTAATDYLFEIKVKPQTVSASQLRGHLAHFTGSAGVDERLIVLSPDGGPPAAIDEVNDPRVAWASFATMAQAIDEAVGDEEAVVGERSEFLLRELKALYRAEGLLDVSDVVVVAARSAYPEYLDNGYHAYVCQAGRFFRPGVQRLGFYTDWQIKPEVPRILASFDSVTFTRPARQVAEAACEDAGIHSEQRCEQLAALIDRMLDDGARTLGQELKVMLLEPPDYARILDHPIDNDTTNVSGRPWAWTLGQRYTSLEKLRRARYTSDLD